MFLNAAAAAVIGGTASKLAGGKFSNGAVTGAFSRIFNDMVSHGSKRGGAPISDEELALAKDGKYIEFWRSRYAAGDPVARTALNGWDAEFKASGIFGFVEKGLANYTWYRLESYINNNDLTVSMEQIGAELALAHASAVMNDPNNLLNSAQVAAYHHSVFAVHNIPARIFGGTHNPLPVGPTPPADLYDFMWCRGCDAK